MEFRILQQRAFTLLELVIAVGLTVILLGFFLRPRSGCKTRPERIACLNNVRQIGVGIRLFAHEHNGLLPYEIPMEKGGSQGCSNRWNTFAHYLVTSNQIGSAKVVFCPADKSRSVATNWNQLNNEHLSYFVTLNIISTDPVMIMSGDRNLTTNRTAFPSGVYGLSTNTGWSDGEIHNTGGNVVLADGSAQQVGSGRLPSLLRATTNTHCVSVP